MNKPLARSMVSLLSVADHEERRRPVHLTERAEGTLQREQSRLMELWESYRSAQKPGTVVVVHGPQAQATSALIKGWRRALLQRGELVFEVSCGGGATYKALRDLVSGYYGHLDDLGLLSDVVQELFDELSVCLGLSGLGQPRTIIDVGAAQPGQVYFYELLGRFFVEASRLRSAVVVVQDLHLADASSLAAFAYVAENFALDPIDEFIPEGVDREGFRGLLALTVEDSALGQKVLGDLEDHLRARSHAEFVNLRGMGEETVRRFLERGEVVERVLALTQGSESNLEALLKMLPQDAEHLFKWRWGRLEEAERRLLEVLAVYGKAMSPDALVHLTEGLDRRSASAALESLQAQGILKRRVGRGALSVHFAHQNSIGFVLRQMAPERRVQLSGMLAGRLLDQQRFGQAVEIEEIAEHLLCSDRHQEAVEYALLAAERLHSTYAYQRAREVLEGVLPLLEQGPALEQVYERLIELSSSLHDYRKALFYCGRLKKMRSGTALAPVYRLIGRNLLRMGKYDLAVRALAKALYKAGQGDLRQEVVRILSSTAEALYGQGQYDRAVEVCHKGLDLAAGDGSAESQRLIVEMTNTLGKVCLFREDYEQASEHFRSNRRLAEQESLGQERLRALFNLGTIEVQRRDYKQAEEIFVRCLSSGHNTANTVVRAFVLLNLAVIYQQTLRFGEALDCYLHALATFKKSGNDLQFAVTALNLGDVYEVLGDMPKARALIDASLELTKAREIRYFHARGCSVRGRIALAEQEPEVALDFFKRARQGLSASGPTIQSRLALRIAQAHHAMGQFAERDQWLEQVGLNQDSAQGRELYGEQELFMATLLADAGEFAKAESHARVALETFEDEALDQSVWRASFQLGRICRGLGRVEEAKSHVSAARAAVDKLSGFIPEALREKYRSEHGRRQLVRLMRALEQGDPFEDREVAAATRKAKAAAAPVEPGVERIGQRRGRAFERWRSRYDPIVGEDPRLHHLFRMIDKVAASDSTILLMGESGTGKELFTEAIHHHSSRSKGPLVKVNCAAFVETLLLSELFGHEKGAFTGALSRKKGRFEMAHGGTIFLDEIGDISANTQVALLRVLQERSFERVGGSGQIDVDVRVVAATNRNLEEMVREGTFRLDLYYRLKGVVMDLPPLRERRGDIARLVRHFTEQFTQQSERARYYSHDALRLLSSYNWPGNIRELENFVRSMLLFVDEQVIDVEHIREFDEFFATGQMSSEPAQLEFVEGWWTPDETEVEAKVVSAPKQDAALVFVEETADGGTKPAEVSDEPPGGDRELTSGSAGAVVPAGEDVDPEVALVEEVVARGMSLQDLKKRLEVECIKRALIETEGNITHAANILKMKRPRLSQIINGNESLGKLKEELALKASG